MSTTFCFTTEIDWASDFAIEQTLNIFRKYDIPLQIFWTHKTPIIEKVEGEELFRGGGTSEL